MLFTCVYVSYFCSHCPGLGPYLSPGLLQGSLFDVPFGFSSNPSSISPSNLVGALKFKHNTDSFEKKISSSFLQNQDLPLCSWMAFVVSLTITIGKPSHWINNALPCLWFSCCFFFLECVLSPFLTVKASHSASKNKRPSPSAQIKQNPPIILCLRLISWKVYCLEFPLGYKLAHDSVNRFF